MTDQTSETTPDGLDVAAVRERMEAATEGPWRWDSWRDDLHHLIGRGGSSDTYEYDIEVIEPEHAGECGCRSACHLTNEVREADRAFIAAARTDIPLLLAALDEARQDAAHWHALLTATTECDGYARLVEQRGWMERAEAAEEALDEARGEADTHREVAESMTGMWQQERDRADRLEGMGDRLADRRANHEPWHCCCAEGSHAGQAAALNRMRATTHATEARAAAAHRALEEAECHIRQLTESRDRAERIADAAEARATAAEDALGRVRALLDWPVGRSTGGVDRLIPADDRRAALDPAVPATEGGA